MNFSCTNQEACPVILDSKCVIYEGENLLYIGVNTNDNYRTALENINTVIGNLILTGGITELTGDVIAVGPGPAIATLATVNSTPGQFGSSTAIPKLTVDGKGRITAITTEAVFIPSGALSFIGDVTGTGNTGSNTTLTLATVNNNVFINNSFLKFAVNAKGLITSASPVNSTDIDSALGYTPYSVTNPAGYISTISGIAAGGELAGTYPNPTLVNAAVTAKVLTGVNITGGSISASDSILTAFGKVQNQINGLIGGSIYQGTWNAATNTPALTSGVGTKGYYYIVNVPGSTNLDGITDWALGDWAIFDGTAWQQVDNTDAVVSVNGQTGAVSLTTDNIPEGLTNQYFLNSRARLALGLTTTGSTGPATYDNITGVFNIPDYSTALSGYVPVGRTLTINGTTYDLSANRSWTVSGLPAGGTAGQILAKIDGTDYNTEWIDNYATQVKNTVKLGAALTKGTAVYVSGADGTNMIVSAASNTTEMTSSKTFGLLETGGALNDQVKVVTYGLLAGLDTSTAVAGDPVWLGANGALLFGIANKPYAPLHLVYIGEVTRVQQNNGEIFINIQNGFEMDELHNVSARNPANNAILAYNTSTSLWEKNTIGGVLGYTPANDALVVHLAGTETITGAKTIDNSINIRDFVLINGDGGSTNGGLAIKQYASAVAASTGYTSLFARTSQLGINYGAAFNTFIDGSGLTANRTLTIPNASGTLALTSDLSSYVPTSRTLTINGVAYDLSADRSWTISTGGVSSFNTRTGAITLTSTDVTSALGYTPYNSTNPSGYITSSGSISGNAGSVGGLTPTQFFNNMGNNHGTYQDFNSVGNFGVRYLQGSTNGPQSGQFYGFTLGLGNEYAYGTYGSQFYWLRNTTNPYIWIRYQEGGSWTSWTKAAAGYADSAGTLSNNSTITGLNFGGVLALTASGASTSNSTGARLTESYGPVWNLSNGATWHHQVINGSYLSGFNANGGNFGNGNYYGTGDVVAYYSDMRLKTKVANITNALDKVKSLEGFTYIENELARSFGYTNTREQSGLSAQQVQSILPEAVSLAPFDMQGVPETGEIVSKSGENYLTVKYDRLVPLLVEAIKEQQSQIEELKTVIDGFTK